MDAEVEHRLPAHGPISCRDCWAGCDADKKEQVTSDGKFRLVNDPGAWGSANPQILVLGISKGNTQAKEFADGEFDQVPFKGCRPRLRDALVAVGLVKPDDKIDQRMTAVEPAFAFGSVVRCSITGLNKGKWSAGAPDVMPAFRHPDAGVWLTNCFKRFFGDLPPLLKIIILLGNSDAWIETIADAAQSLYPKDFKRVNPVAYMAGGKLWVHLGHPSPANGHFGNFIHGSVDSGQGQKREWAEKVIGQCLVDNPDPR